MCISRVSKRVKEGCGAPRVMGLLFQCRPEMMVQCSPRRLRNKVSQGGISTACFISCVSACVSAFTPHTHIVLYCLQGHCLLVMQLTTSTDSLINSD